MLADLRALLLGDSQSKPSRETLTGWRLANQTGASRLWAGVPPGWRVGDKTGTGNHGTTNDVAIVWPPDQPPILIAVYLTQTSADPAARNGVLADVARLVIDSGMSRDAPPASRRR